MLLFFFRDLLGYVALVNTATITTKLINGHKNERRLLLRSWASLALTRSAFSTPSKWSSMTRGQSRGNRPFVKGAYCVSFFLAAVFRDRPGWTPTPPGPTCLSHVISLHIRRIISLVCGEECGVLSLAKQTDSHPKQCRDTISKLPQSSSYPNHNRMG